MKESVLIVDDHAQFRHSARRLLERSGYPVVGEAEDGHSGLAEAERLRPGLVLLDVFLPDTDGFEVAEQLTGDGIAVVVLISSRDGPRLRAARRAERGARVHTQDRARSSPSREHRRVLAVLRYLDLRKAA